MIPQLPIFHGEFWAGATITTLMRMEAILGRVFFDYDSVTVKDPIKTLADSGVNAIRVETSRAWGQQFFKTMHRLGVKSCFSSLILEVSISRSRLHNGLQL